jgi:RNA polymerase sigma factor (sigma-70 family)
VRDDPTLAALVARAAKGDQNAWEELVERFAPLVWSICRRYSLERMDVDDVAQTVWLKLVEGLPTIREPNALAGWIATTTQRECLRLLRVNRRVERGGERLAEETATVLPPTGIIEEEIIKAEWQRALLIAFGQLPLPCRELLSLLMQEPPVPYTEVSRRLGIPVGGIGPRRARCLAKLRRCQPPAGLLGEEDGEDGRAGESGG